MRVIIIGAGNAGRRLAAKLCEEKHDVVLIDQRVQALDDIASQLDILTIHGNGVSPRVLEEAGVQKADLLAALTNRDEVNILAAVFSHAAGTLHTVVRVSNTEYLNGSEAYDLHRLGIELVVNEHDECALEVLKILSMRGASEVVEMVEGRIQAVGLKLPSDSSLLEAPLKEFPKQGLLSTVRIIAVMRGEDLIMPHGNTRFAANDTIYFVGRPLDVRAFLDCVHPNQPTIEKVIIAGGGDHGLRLAQCIEPTAMQVVVIEQDEHRAHECSAALDHALVIRGSTLDKETLKEAGVTNNSAVVAATGHDENNIIACLLAKKLGAAFTIALISNPEYVPIINDSSLLDRAVSPYSATINAVLRFVRGTNIRAAALLQNVPGELLEVEIPSHSKWTGEALKNIRLPERAIVTTVLRGHEAEVATGDTVLQAGDRLVIFSPPGAANKLQSIFHK